MVAALSAQWFSTPQSWHIVMPSGRAATTSSWQSQFCTGILRPSGIGPHRRSPEVCCKTPELTSCPRSEEHTSELQSLMSISYAVFRLQHKITTRHLSTTYNH